MVSRDVSRFSPDPTALKALTHPVRLRMLGMLRIDGPATASGLATRLGLNSGATSYHLRQLALHGFIEEDEARGSKRDRWWRASHESTSFLTAQASDEALETGLAFARAAVQWQIRQIQGALDAYPDLADDWRHASTISDSTIPLSADAARELTAKLQAILDEAKAAAPPLGEPIPQGLRPFTIILHAAPHVADTGGQS